MAKVKLMDLKNPDERARPRKYGSMMDAFDDMRNARMIERKTPAQIWEKFNPLCSKKFKLQSLQKAFMTMGVNKAMRQMIAAEKVAVKRAIKSGIRHARGIARHNSFVQAQARPKVESAAAEAIATRIVERKKAAAEKHFDRMDEYVERAHGVLEKCKPRQKNLGQFLNNVDHADSIARKTYGIADEKPVSSHQFQIGILLSLGDSQSTEPEPIDVESR